MREGARRVIITVSALVLIGITVFCISGTVHSSERWNAGNGRITTVR